MRASSPALNEHKRLPNVHMVRFNLRYDTRKAITSRELLHQLDINETLISTVTMLMESTFPSGATISSSRPVRLKVLTTKTDNDGPHRTQRVLCSGIKQSMFVDGPAAIPTKHSVRSHWGCTLDAYRRALFSVLFHPLFWAKRRNDFDTQLPHHRQPSLRPTWNCKGHAKSGDPTTGSQERRIAISMQILTAAACTGSRCVLKLQRP